MQMDIVQGKYAGAVLFTDTADIKTKEQIKAACDSKAFEDCKIRIMPDCHAGKGCVVGFTSTVNNRVIPNIVGVDIGCFTGETEVQVVGEGNIPFKELVHRKDKFYVYTVNGDGIIVVSKAKCVKTRENAEIVKVTLDNGEIIECTPDHQFMLRSGEYVRADCLTERTSLMPLSHFIDSDGYEVVYQPNLKKTERFNRTIAQYAMGIDIEGYHIHHIDGVKLNNFPENLECKTSEMHSREHIFNSGREGFFKTDEFKSKRKEVLDKNGYFDEKFREKKKQVAIENITNYMKNNPTSFEKVVQENAKRGSEFFSGCNRDENMRILQKFGRIKKVLDLIATDGKEMSRETYEEYRTGVYNGINVDKVSELLQKYSITLQDLMEKEKWNSYILNNHKVVSVEKVDGLHDVYCLQVDKYHNFALKSGVFVHNCGMLTLCLGKIDIDLEKLDEAIHKFVPCGFNVNSTPITNFEDVTNYKYPSYLPSGNINRIECSIGTLGGGNHFIEVDEDTEGNKYLVIHTGSRNLGVQVCNHYQILAEEQLTPHVDIKAVIDNLKATGQEKEIQGVLASLGKIKPIKNDLAYLQDELLGGYLEDMEMCQEYAELNRNMIAITICMQMGWDYAKNFQTIHNYIGRDKIIRKGAVSAYNKEILLIPLNMRDGSLICEGKGNSEWNYSAPHGAGRILSRTGAFKELDLAQFKEDMKGVYSTTVTENTLDEAPRAYKPVQEIIDNIGDTVKIVKHIKPIYNFKADNDKY